MSTQRSHKSTAFSDIDLSRWKEYDDVILDSLWLLGPRDKTGPHVGDYWGNFIPQIPYQVLTRFTKRGDIVVDFFSGMGTTLIECKRLGRTGLGVEIDPVVADRSVERINSAENPFNVPVAVLVGDSTTQHTANRVLPNLTNGAPLRLIASSCIHPITILSRLANVKATYLACHQRRFFWTKSAWSRNTPLICLNPPGSWRS